MKTPKKKFSTDFSDVEDHPEGSKEINRLASEAFKAAASEARVAGLPQVYAKGNKVIREYPDGKIEVIFEQEQPFFIEMKETILHARKK
jgi:hypothetical protein